jgi:parallel beta-helix repeat protein
MKSWRLSLVPLLLLIASPSLAKGKTEAITAECTQAGLLAALATANNGGGTISLSCQNTTISMTQGLGDIQSNVILDGGTGNVTLEYTGTFSGCSVGDNGIGGPAIGRIRGHGNVVRGLTFKNFLESLQIDGPDNTIENNTFLGHYCSDDGLSINQTAAVNTVIRNNHLEGYEDKAIQMSYGGGLIESNTFLDTKQPIRAPYDNSGGDVWRIVDNQIVTSGDRGECHGVRIDGTYVIEFERNLLECQRGIRLGGGTQIVIRDNVIRGNDRVGIRVGGSAVASISGNTITGNGLILGSLPSGGVVVWENGTADLGGGTLTIGGKSVHSAGNNILQGNGVADVNNLRTDHVVEAENNCWDGTTESAIPADISGDVDFTPFNHPGAIEVCDGVDNDCNGEIDDNCVEASDPAAAACGTTGHVAWVAYRAETDSTDILYRACTAPGGCTGLQRLAASPADQSAPAVACDGSTVIVVWEDLLLENRDIFYRRSTDGGRSFGPTGALQILSTEDRDPAIAMSGDLVVAAWEDHRLGNADIAYRVSRDGGATFGPELLLTSSPLDDRHVDLGVSGEFVVALWEEASAGNRSIAFRHSADGGETWGPQQLLTDEPTHESRPRIAIDGSVALAVWTDERDLRDDVYSGQSFDGGATFPYVSLLVGTPDSDDQAPDVVLQGSGALVAWTDTRDGSPNVSVIRSADGGTSWSPIQPLLPVVGHGRDVSCAIAVPGIACVWSDFGTGVPHAGAALSRDGGATWPVAGFLH